jgi:hypothetical protein
MRALNKLQENRNGKKTEELNRLVNDFLKGKESFAVYERFDIFYIKDKNLLMNDDIILIKRGKNIFANAHSLLNISRILNSIEGIKAEYLGGGAHNVNGMRYDGEKVNINLFN